MNEDASLVSLMRRRYAEHLRQSTYHASEARKMEQAISALGSNAAATEVSAEANRFEGRWFTSSLQKAEHVYRILVKIGERGVSIDGLCKETGISFYLMKKILSVDRVIQGRDGLWRINGNHQAPSTIGEVAEVSRDNAA